MKKRLFSGVQPTGNLHVGNYLGAIRQWVSLQGEYDTILCVVDLHAITVFQEPAVLRSKTKEVAGLLFAAGIDPKVTSVFIQSHVSAHSELAWIFECLIPFGWLGRMTQFKEKKTGDRSNVSAGLFNYPALMAADILLYDIDVVPVGEDQRQHLELARDVAQRVNSLYGDTFKLPQPLIAENGARIMGLDDPTRKMSKSTHNPGHAINLLDSPDAISAKIARATTDSFSEIRFDENRPGINNLLVLYQGFTGLDRPEIESHFAGKGYAGLKTELAEIIISSLKPVQARYKALMATPGYIDSLLAEGEAKVKPYALNMLEKINERLGLG
jgi:tryptophanyl-tRNA synthetase